MSSVFLYVQYFFFFFFHFTVARNFGPFLFLRRFIETSLSLRFPFRSLFFKFYSDLRVSFESARQHRQRGRRRSRRLHGISFQAVQHAYSARFMTILNRSKVLRQPEVLLYYRSKSQFLVSYSVSYPETTQCNS